MKTCKIHNFGIGCALLCLLGLTSLVTFAVPPAAPVAWHDVTNGDVVWRDAATHEQLTVVYQQSQQVDPMRNLKPMFGPDPSVLNRPKDILTESDIVCFRKFATLVPKRAILMIPKNYFDRIHLQPGAIIQGWADFYSANRGWITTVEVSRAQAEGNVPIADQTFRQMSLSGNLVVATYLGGPISVLPLKVPAKK